MMISEKFIIVAASRNQYQSFCRVCKLNPYEHIYARSIPQMHGRHWDTPVMLLEGYQYSTDLTLGLMHFIGHRFTNINVITEAEMYRR